MVPGPHSATPVEGRAADPARAAMEAAVIAAEIARLEAQTAQLWATAQQAPTEWDRLCAQFAHLLTRLRQVEREIATIEARLLSAPDPAEN